MSFTFEIPGQPPSRNHSYRIVRVKHRDGSSHQQLGKVPGVEQYQLIASALARQAKPKDWDPPDQIRVKFWFYVKRDIDADNALKAIQDAIAIGLDVNDRRFLPCVEAKVTGTKEPHTRVEVE